MSKNVSTADASIRGLLAVGLLVAAIVWNAHAVVAFAAALGGVILAGTALTRECPLYHAFRLSTARRGRS